eukprot:g19405.t1
MTWGGNLTVDRWAGHPMVRRGRDLTLDGWRRAPNGARCCGGVGGLGTSAWAGHPMGHGGMRDRAVDGRAGHPMGCRVSRTS